MISENCMNRWLIGLFVFANRSDKLVLGFFKSKECNELSEYKV